MAVSLHGEGPHEAGEKVRKATGIQTPVASHAIEEASTPTAVQFDACRVAPVVVTPVTARLRRADGGVGVHMWRLSEPGERNRRGRHG